jgi:hypothetical protein
VTQPTDTIFEKTPSPTDPKPIKYIVGKTG